MKVAIAVIGALWLGLAACSDTTPLPSEAVPALAAGGGGGALTVLTRNLYVGTDVDAVIGALASPDPSDDVAALVSAIETLRLTDFPARAAALAGEVARSRPHLIGLQEVSEIDLTLPPLGVDLHIHFLPLFLAELTNRGLDYAVAAQVRNIEAAPFPGVQLVDYDVLLVDRARVALHSAEGSNFSVNLGEVAPGVVLRRGYVLAAGAVDGVEYTFATTHLESGSLPGLAELRAAQAAELAQAMGGAERAVLMGDLNDVPGSPMYQALLAARFTDVWAALRPGVAGYTCCHATDLSNAVEAFTQRIDYVLARGVGRGQRDVTGQVTRLGEVPADRIAGPEFRIWPSDHAGLAAELRRVPAQVAVP
jgi:endonuclease/exonuclease/phosphatase family metal-dependent hydrolase